MTVSAPSIWQTSRFAIDLSSARVMGIVNVTPDSFSDGGGSSSAWQAVDRCKRLLDEGADLLDIGGESTRPGAEPVDATDELRRVMPVIEAAVRMGCAVSVDTLKPPVMQAALDAGVDVVNDVTALRGPGAMSIVAEHPANCGVCLMHMQGEPRSMQAKPRYGDVVADVARFLAERASSLQALGVAANRIAIDPGIGFGKTVEQNFALLNRQRELLTLGFPLLAGWSRKSSLGVVTGRAVEDRVAASVAAALVAVLHGAKVLRVHDVAATVDALKVWRAAGVPGA